MVPWTMAEWNGFPWPERSPCSLRSSAMRAGMVWLSGRPISATIGAGVWVRCDAGNGGGKRKVLARQPLNRTIGSNLGVTAGERDVFDDESRYPLALALWGTGVVPKGGEIGVEPENLGRCSLMRTRWSF